VNQRYVRWWVMQHAHRVVREFEESKKKEELIPTGSPLDFVPRPYARAEARSAEVRKRG
jgi:arylsulfatase